MTSMRSESALFSRDSRRPAASGDVGRDPWFVRLRHRPDAALRLFCFPYAGGGPSAFRLWADRLPDAVDLWAVQYPGRERRIGEPPCTHLHRLVASLHDALRPHLDRPFAFLGHSMGALVAYETTRALQTRTDPSPQHLFVSGRRAPHCPPPPDAKTLHDLPDDALVEELRALGGMDPDVLANAELMTLLFPLLRADLRLVETYTHDDGPTLNCGISALGGLSDAFVRHEHLRAWSRYTDARFRCHLFPGDHFYLTRDVHAPVQVVLRTLARVTSIERSAHPVLH